MFRKGLHLPPYPSKRAELSLLTIERGLHEGTLVPYLSVTQAVPCRNKHSELFSIYTLFWSYPVLLLLFVHLTLTDPLLIHPWLQDR